MSNNISNMKQINLDDWVQSGSGAVGMSYFHKTDESLMLKFMNAGTDVESIEKELNNSRNIFGLGIPTPKPGELVTDGERLGIVFQRIKGKRSYARIIGEEPENIDALALEFAGLCKELHNTKCDTSKFLDVKKSYGDMIRRNPFRSEGLKSRALAALEALPDTTTCLHGDLHFGNVIKADGKSYFIDLLDFCYGYPLLDFGAMGSLIIVMKNMEEIFEREYHCTVAQGTQFWHMFLKGYFGPDTDVKKKEQELLPYIAIKTLTMEFESNIRIPDISAEEVYSVFGGDK